MNHKSRSWCMVPEIWVQRTKLFVIFVMKCNRQNFFYLGLSFALVPPLPSPLTAPKKKISKKRRENKTPRDIIILQKCTKNHDHMPYCSWDKAHDGRNCNFLFWANLYPFTPLTVRKIKIKQKRKKHLEISSFYKSAPKIMIIYYTVLEIWHVADVLVIFHSGLFFALLPPNPP